MERPPLLRRLFQWQGTINRGEYFALGIGLFATKYLIDRTVAWEMFHRAWTPLNYYASAAVSVLGLSRDEQRFYYTMLAIAIPFIWVGVRLTVKRLRDLEYPLAWAVLFFVPVVNTVFFCVLCILPGKGDAPGKVSDKPRREPGKTRSLEDMVPESKLGAAVIGVLLCVPVTLLVTGFGVKVLGNYGWGLFVGLPFVMGFISSAVYNVKAPRRPGESAGVALLSLLVGGGVLLLFAFEGIICLLMALPLAAPLAIFGGGLAHSIFSRPAPSRPVPQMLGAVILVLPLLMAGEQSAHLPPKAIAIRSEVVVNAPAQRVWDQLIAFAQIPDQREWLFHTGVAYPIRAEIQGQGPGAVRYCVFSTGAFVEPIEVWDEPHRLGFGVRSQPPVMQEWSPFAIQPPHLAQNYLLSKRGEFRLEDLADGRTRLIGTTWYENRFWPGAYWQVWSDYFIHRIHMRVLEHIRTLAEKS